MANPGDFAYTVKQQADIVRIIGDYVKLKKAGAQNFSGLCPFHGEKTRVVLRPRHAPVLSLLRLRRLRRRLQLRPENRKHHLPRSRPPGGAEARHPVAQGDLLDSRRSQRSPPARPVARRSRTRRPAFFQDCLHRPEGARAREYLLGRGLDEDTIAHFRIGYAPDSGFLLRDRLKTEFDEDLLRESGLFSWKEAASRRAPESRSPRLNRRRRRDSSLRSE